MKKRICSLITCVSILMSAPLFGVAQEEITFVDNEPDALTETIDTLTNFDEAYNDISDNDLTSKDEVSLPENEDVENSPLTDEPQTENIIENFGESFENDTDSSVAKEPEFLETDVDSSAEDNTENTGDEKETLKTEDEIDINDSEPSISFMPGNDMRFIVKYIQGYDGEVPSTDQYTVKTIYKNDSLGRIDSIKFEAGIDAESFFDNAEKIFDMNSVEIIQRDICIELPKRNFISNIQSVPAQLSSAGNDTSVVAVIDAGADLIFPVFEGRIFNNLFEHLETNTFKQDCEPSTDTADELIVEQLDGDNDITEFSSENNEDQAVVDEYKPNEETTISNDIIGWDFCNMCGITNCSEALFDYGATAVAGMVIDAIDNAQILNLKVFENGTAYMSDIIEAITYAEEAGASYINLPININDDSSIIASIAEVSPAEFINVENAPMQQTTFFNIDSVTVDVEHREIAANTDFYSPDENVKVSIKLQECSNEKLIYIGQGKASDRTHSIGMPSNASGQYNLYMRMDGYGIVSYSFVYNNGNRCFNFNKYEDTLTVHGIIADNPNKRVSVKFENENNEVIWVSQTLTKNDGSFTVNAPYSGSEAIVAYICVNGTNQIFTLTDPTVKSGNGAVYESENPKLYKAIITARSNIDTERTGVITESELRNITGTLILSGFGISDITELQNCTNVTALYIDNNNITDISPISHMSRLKTLFAQNNLIGSLPDDITDTLEILNLSNNCLANANPIRKLHNLKSLYLDNNFISEISFLNGTPKLKWLSLNGNNIVSIYAVSKSGKLLHADLSDNKIHDVSPLSELNELSDLRLSNNNIENISSLYGQMYNYLYVDGNQVTAIDIESLNAVNLVYDRETK